MLSTGMRNGYSLGQIKIGKDQSEPKKLAAYTQFIPGSIVGKSGLDYSMKNKSLQPAVSHSML
jgi:hypothetical protein